MLRVLQVPTLNWQVGALVAVKVGSLTHQGFLGGGLVGFPSLVVGWYPAPGLGWFVCVDGWYPLWSEGLYPSFDGLRPLILITPLWFEELDCRYFGSSDQNTSRISSYPIQPIIRVD